MLFIHFKMYSGTCSALLKRSYGWDLDLKKVQVQEKPALRSYGIKLVKKILPITTGDGLSSHQLSPSYLEMLEYDKRLA